MLQKTPYEHNRELLAGMTPAMRYDGREPFRTGRLVLLQSYRSC